MAADSGAPEAEFALAEAQAAMGRVSAADGVNVRTGPGLAMMSGASPLKASRARLSASARMANGGLPLRRARPMTRAGFPPPMSKRPMQTMCRFLTPRPWPPSSSLPEMEAIETPDELDPESVIVFSASRVLREGNRGYDLEDIYAVSAQPGSEATLIIQNAMQPSVLRGGNIMAFRSVQADQLGLSAYDFDADERVRYSANLEDSTPRWSPNGDRVVFSSNRTGDRRWHVYIVEPIPSNDRTGFPEVIDLGFGKDADWHPD